MKVFTPALAAALFAFVSAGSAAKAAVINFSAVALCPVSCTGITYAGANLGTSTAIDLDGSTWEVATRNAGDASGLGVGNALLGPTSAMYGALSGSGLNIVLTTPIIKTWTGAFGSFTETLTTLTEIDRGTNSIAFFLTGTVTGGLFHNTPATLEFSLTQAGGPGNVVSASLTNHAVSSAVPEPATWAMMALGFAALGYAGLRRSRKDRSAFAV